MAEFLGCYTWVWLAARTDAALPAHPHQPAPPLPSAPAPTPKHIWQRAVSMWCGGVKRARVQPSRDTASIDHHQFKPVHTEERVGLTLSSSDIRSLCSAHTRCEPVLLKCPPGCIDQKEVMSSWSAFVTASGLQEYSTYEHGLQSLRTVWDSPLGMRMETSLRAGTEDNAVEDWMSRAVNLSVRCLHSLHRRLLDLGTDLSMDSRAMRHPSFVTGLICDGCGSTHQDGYTNLALVAVGCKVFYVAESSSRGFIDRAPVRGKDHERRGVNPYNSSTFAPRGSLDCVPQEVWSVAVLEPGDVLYLPVDYWHWVYSSPHSVMTNIWIV